MEKKEATIDLFIAMPFIHDVKDRWFTRFVQNPQIKIKVIPAGYEHDRSRKSTSATEWIDYLKHAIAVLINARRSTQSSRVIVTGFPQLAVLVGLLKPLICPRAKVIAWYFNLGQSYTGIKAKLASTGLNNIDVIVAHSTAEVDLYERLFSLPKGKVTFAPLAIDYTSVDVEEDTEHPFILALGTANRDYETFFNAVKDIDIDVVVVAGRHAISGLEVPSNVNVLSNISMEECKILARRSSMVVIPVHDVGTAAGQVSVIEAMALKKAVIATRTVGVVDYAKDGENAILVPPADSGSLRKAIRKLECDAALRYEIEANAFAFVLESCTAESSSNRIELIINDIFEDNDNQS
tara:strand:- start:44509 stop:45561 length:1053 start_codon:yes stop_codon:yes gene_type:complete